MWPWRLPRRRHELLLWQLVSVSTIIHCGVLILLLFVYRGQFCSYDITVGRVSDPNKSVVFMPLIKSIPQKKGAGGARKNGKKGAGITSKNEQKKVVAPQKQKNGIAQKTKPVVAPVRSAQQDQKSKATFVQPEQKAVVKKQAPKKETVKKEAEKKQVVEKTSPKKEISVKKEEVLPVKQEVKKDEVVKHEQEAVIAQEQTTSNESMQAVPESSGEHAEVHYIGQAERDAAQMQLLIQQEVEHHWRPPVGLSANLECDVQVKIGWDQKAESIIIQKPSGVLVYDIHARSAVVAMQFPQMACGKELCIHFKQ